ncbi:sensor histidine kinase and response regulator of a two component complex [Planoprotostelium fungivorum]|uniref:Sensor histidine kinase and response regulator of a two component complex n=1 Tax=Planoprotostelium fungivorum TaxID=1890364 RepID=A0A2P6NE39_9EUKA|nr:sensor histidine kinase and response regulator of a two component complex [Planoprotostelium fungivorum]
MRTVHNEWLPLKGPGIDRHLSMGDPIAPARPKFIPAPDPPNEKERMEMLHSLDLLDTDFEEYFDGVVSVVQKMFDVPYSMICLLDSNRYFNKSVINFQVEGPREGIICGYTILKETINVIEDMTLAKNYENHHLVVNPPYLKFYAGVPLAIDGCNVGTLCIMDLRPRRFTQADRDALVEYAQSVVRGFEMRKALKEAIEISQQSDEDEDEE